MSTCLSRILIVVSLCIGCHDEAPPASDSGGQNTDMMSMDQVEELSDLDMSVTSDGSLIDEGPQGRLVINEVVAKPLDGEADWIELFVAGDVPISLSEYALVDEDPEHAPYALPDERLAPGSYWRIDVGDTADQFPFGLGGQDQVRLLRGEELVDQLSWDGESSVRGYSYGRYPDGAGDGELLTPTPNATNQRPEQAPQRLFPSDEVIPVHLELEEADWRAIQADPLAQTYYQGHLQYGAERLENVAIRVKGNSSLYFVSRTPSVRFSFKVDTNKYVEGQRLLGVKKLNFNNGFKDPTLLRESVAYELYRSMGRPAPRTAFVDLTVAGQHLGLYTAVEQVDDVFLGDHFTDTTGDLYKPEMPSGLLTDRGDDIERYEEVGLKTNEETTDHAAFLRLIEVINHPDLGSLDEVLHIDDYLMNLAINLVLVNLDSYLGMAHNFYLYERDGVFTEIPWDLNEAFANFTCGCNRAQLVGYLIDEPTCSRLSSRPLLERIFAEPMYVARYHQMLSMVIEGAGSLESLTESINTKADLIRPYVEADPTKFFSFEEFEQGLNDDVRPRGNNAPEACGLTSFTEERIQNILGQLAGEIASTNQGNGNCEERGPVEPGPVTNEPNNCPPCGDGICDGFERDYPELCPRDCQDPPASGDWCGDGICDALEACLRDCPQDCN